MVLYSGYNIDLTGQLRRDVIGLLWVSRDVVGYEDS